MSSENDPKPSGVPPRQVSCPACGAPVPWVPGSRWRPFCSKRCRTLDLGAWAAGEYRIPESQSPESDEDIL